MPAMLVGQGFRHARRPGNDRRAGRGAFGGAVTVRSVSPFAVDGTKVRLAGSSGGGGSDDQRPTGSQPVRNP